MEVVVYTLLAAAVSGSVRDLASDTFPGHAMFPVTKAALDEIRARPQEPFPLLITAPAALDQTSGASIVPASGGEGLPALIVKYVDDCRERFSQREHFFVGLESEFAVMAALNDTGLVPRVYFLSEAVGIPAKMEDMDPRTLNKKLKLAYETCVGLGTHIRYMVEERVGPSILDYIEWIALTQRSLFESNELRRILLIVYKKALVLLERIHVLGVMHGDIHFGNIAFKRPVTSLEEIVNLESEELVLIDFEQSFFYPALFGAPLKARRSNQGLTPFLLSVWRLAGEREGPRDDVYRLTFQLANVSSRLGYRAGVDRLVTALLVKRNIEKDSDNGIAITGHINWRVKSSEPLFKKSAVLNSSIRLTSVPRIREIVENLEEIHEHIKSCHSPDTTVDYASIHARVDFVISALSPPTISEKRRKLS